MQGRSGHRWTWRVAAALVACAVVLGSIGVTTASAAPKRGLSATYYDDTAFRRRVLTRVDPRIHFAWRTGSPTRRIARDTFAARWQGYLVVPRRGRYTISMRASDGVRVWVDGRLRINRWGRAARVRESATSLVLGRGRHRLRVDYYEHTGTASASLYWKGPGIRRQVVPAARLAPLPTPTGPARPWSSPSTWGGKVPANGSVVTIPAGRTVLLDRDVSLANLTVNGTLVFARRNLTLEADWIVVRGALQVGTASRPFLQRATIRLLDRRPGQNIMHMGDKVLGVMGGTLDLHGASRLAWTRLSATGTRGSNRITLARVANWRPGDRIAIASTDFAHAQHEEATITAVSGRTLTLDRALEHTHFGVMQTIAGRRLDERAEVALLSRNVTVEGEAASSADGMGAQVLVLDGGTARISGAQLQRVGQRGQLRRYPLHFHMLRDEGAGSYLRNSSVHHSNNRCVTVHGTNQVSVTGNVCYDHAGHGFFLEDGGERDNVFSGNLGFGTRAPDEEVRLLPSDGSPATFWITNPDNVVRGNVAGGSEGHGFWIALPEHPTGLFATMYPDEARAWWPRRTPLGAFTDNVAHSNGQDGLHFDRGPRPDGHTETAHHHARANPADTKSATVVTEMRGFTAYKNRGHGAWLRGTEHRMVASTLADNAVGATFASDESFLQDSFVVGESGNVGMPERWEVRSGGVGRDGRSAPKPWDADFPIRGFEFYDGRVGVERTTFANFQPWRTPSGAVREQAAIGAKLDNDFSIHPRNFATAVQFANARAVYLQTPPAGRDGSQSTAFLDTDGSVTGAAGRTVTALNPFLLGAACHARADWNANVCTGTYASLLVGAPGNPAALRPVTITRADGQVQTLQASSDDDADDANTTVLANAAYRVAFNGGTPQRTRFVLRNGAGRWVRVSIPRTQPFRVMRYGCDVARAGSWCHGAAASQAALDGQSRPGYWYDDHGDANPATGTLHLKVTADADSDWSELVVE